VRFEARRERSRTLARPARLALALALAAPGAVAAAPSAARPAPWVDVTVEACAGVDAAQVRRIAGVELRARIDRGPAEATLPSVQVTCDGDQAAVRIADADGRPARQRTVALAGIAEVARARLLALAIAELILAPASPPPPPPPAAARPPAPAPVIAAAAPPPRREAAAALLALGHARAWGSGWASAGAGVAASVWVGPRLLLRGDALFERGAARVPEGRVTADGVSLSAAALLAARRGGWQLGAGAGLRGGLTRLAGEPADPAAVRGGSFRGPSGGPMGVLTIAPPPLSRIALQLALEAGRVTLPLTGRSGDVQRFAVEGFWFGAALGVGLAL
jgi:hypothetical protein